MTEQDGEAQAARRRARRRAEVFGEVLPELTQDEHGTHRHADEDWYRAQRPPHHGD